MDDGFQKEQNPFAPVQRFGQPQKGPGGNELVDREQVTRLKVHDGHGSPLGYQQCGRAAVCLDSSHTTLNAHV